MEKIEWLEWSPEVFARARAEDKLVLLNITADWCHWCHVVDEEWYSDPEIVRIIGREYLPVRVNSDARPDINDRYNQGGWPSAVILTGEGFVVHGVTYLPADALRELLVQAMEWHRENRERVSAAAEEMARTMDESGSEQPPGRAEPADFLSAVTKDIKKNADPVHGGFGSDAKFPMAGAVSLAISHYFFTDDRPLLEFVETTLTRMSEGLLDAEDGGLFRFSVSADWRQPHFEKNLNVNAESLRNYLECYRLTGNESYTKPARNILEYIHNTLLNEAGAGFFASQDADIYDADTGTIVVPGEKYYGLSSAERARLGRPRVDTTIYTNWNSLMISACLDAYHTLEEEKWRESALMTVEMLMERCFDERNGAYHWLIDGTAGGPALLTDNVALARANLDAYETTGARKYLENARLLMDFVIRALRAPDGGFLDSPIDANMPPAMRIRHEPLHENALAIEVLARLFNYTANSYYYEQAETALMSFREKIKALLARDMGYHAAELALAGLYLRESSTKIAVVGSASDETAADLRREAKRIYRPVKMVQFLDPKTDIDLIKAMNYEPANRPVAHVCTEKGCAEPVYDIEALREILASA